MEENPLIKSRKRLADRMISTMVLLVIYLAVRAAMNAAIQKLKIYFAQ